MDKVEFSTFNLNEMIWYHLLLFLCFLCVKCNEEDLIFVGIPSYRDDLLRQTISNAIEKAKYPDNLRFGIVMQDSQEAFDKFPYKENPNLKIIFKDWKESQGCCWARTLVQTFYAGEKYHLQIDAHMNFLKDWDQFLIEELSRCPSTKPILSTYLPSWDIKNDTLVPHTIEMVPSKFHKDVLEMRSVILVSDNSIDELESKVSTSSSIILSLWSFYIYLW